MLKRTTKLAPAEGYEIVQHESPPDNPEGLYTRQISCRNPNNPLGLDIGFLKEEEPPIYGLLWTVPYDRAYDTIRWVGAHLLRQSRYTVQDVNAKVYRGDNLDRIHAPGYSRLEVTDGTRLLTWEQYERHQQRESLMTLYADYSLPLGGPAVESIVHKSQPSEPRLPLDSLQSTLSTLQGIYEQFRQHPPAWML